MAKLFSMVIAVVFGISFIGLGVVQASDFLTGSSPIIVASGKTDDKHGKAGDDHGKAGDDDHGKAGDDHGKTDDDHHGKTADKHGKKKKAKPNLMPQ